MRPCACSNATELDPVFFAAYGRAASCYALAKTNGWFSDTPDEIAEVTRLTQRAVELGKDDALALGASGWTLAFVVSRSVGRRRFDRSCACA